MSGVEEFVVVVNLVCVLVSVVANVWAARVGLLRCRTAHAAIAAVSGIYVVGYLWLLSGDVTGEAWSSVFRGISLVAWVVVWIIPALLSVKFSRELHRAIEERHKEAER